MKQPKQYTADELKKLDAFRSINIDNTMLVEMEKKDEVELPIVKRAWRLKDILICLDIIQKDK